MVANQVRHAQSTMERGLDIPIIGRRAVQTRSMREWSTTLSRLRVANSLFARPWVAGIAPGKDGAYSVCLSGGYEDDVDEGYALSVLSMRAIPLHLTRINCSTYTGSGGRDLKGTKTAPKNVRCSSYQFLGRV